MSKILKMMIFMYQVVQFKNSSKSELVIDNLVFPDVLQVKNNKELRAVVQIVFSGAETGKTFTLSLPKSVLRFSVNSYACNSNLAVRIGWFSLVLRFSVGGLSFTLCIQVRPLRTTENLPFHTLIPVVYWSGWQVRI